MGRRSRVPIGLLVAGWLVLSMGGCTGTIFPEDGGTQPKPQFLIQSIALQGTTQDDCAVKVQEVPDQDGTDDAQWRVDFMLNGRGEANSLPEDTGQEQAYILGVQGIRTSDSETYYKKVTITLYD